MGQDAHNDVGDPKRTFALKQAENHRSCRFKNSIVRPLASIAAAAL